MAEIIEGALSERSSIMLEISILSIKKKSANFEEFLENCKSRITITYPEIVKKIYWDKDFEKELILKSKVIMNKPKDVYRYLVDHIQLSMTEKEFMRRVYKII